RKETNGPPTRQGVNASTNRDCTSYAGSTNSGNPTVPTNNENAADRNPTAEGRAGERPKAPPNCRNSTVVNGADTSRPQISSNTDTASGVSSRNNPDFSTNGPGSGGSL